MLNAFIDRCCRWINLLIALALAVMVVMVFGNVVLRYAFNSGIAISEEVSRWLFVWITFLGAIVAVRDTWLLFSGALAQSRINWDVDAPVTGASMAIFYASGVGFAVAAGLLLALDLWRIVSGQMPDSELVQISESEELAAVGSQLPHAPPRAHGITPVSRPPQ